MIQLCVGICWFSFIILFVIFLGSFDYILDFWSVILGVSGSYSSLPSKQTIIMSRMTGRSWVIFGAVAPMTIYVQSPCGLILVWLVCLGPQVPHWSLLILAEGAEGAPRPGSMGPRDGKGVSGSQTDIRGRWMHNVSHPPHTTSLIKPPWCWLGVEAQLAAGSCWHYPGREWKTSSLFSLADSTPAGNLSITGQEWMWKFK